MKNPIIWNTSEIDQNAISTMPTPKRNVNIIYDNKGFTCNKKDFSPKTLVGVQAYVFTIFWMQR